MKTFSGKNLAKTSQKVAGSVSKEKGGGKSDFQFEDKRAETLQMQKLQEAINHNGPIQLMKRAPRTHDLISMGNSDSSAQETKPYTSGNITKNVPIGRIRQIQNRESGNKVYDISEILIVSITNSQSPELLQTNPDLYNIYNQVCRELGIETRYAFIG